ncbi:1800_t:CDS:2 [Funneliformis geosporum]|uniref:1800_t:CDS:1 n=1 Tax=Funneliformis geosporum TaxID=1117311 RepID=A0A9W4SC49_9GLOM|nr:1800_t:CDS:2 [Funneliformis geosporum]
MENSKWLEQAIKEGHINFHEYENFSDVEVIGRGAFGEVYKATWNNRGMIVALKSLLSPLEENVSPQLLNELIKEGTEYNSRSNINKSIDRRSVSSFPEISPDLLNAINDVDKAYHNGHIIVAETSSTNPDLSSELMSAINQMDKVHYNNNSDNVTESRSIKSLRINSSASSNSQITSSSLKSPRLPKSRRSSFNSPPSSPTSLTHGRIQNTDKAFLEELLKFFEELIELSPDTTTMISKLKGYLHNRMREHKSTFKLLNKYHNDVRFACLIGYFMECAIGTAQDKYEAFKYYQKSADSKDSNGQYFLGRCYYRGYGIKQDRKKAFQFLKTSSDNGNSRGQWMLGFCYERGYGTVKDPTQAFNQFLASAEAGNVTSQMELGRCYEEGIGTKKNIQLAIECYEKSYKGGYTLAKNKLDNILRIQRRLQLSKQITVNP